MIVDPGPSLLQPFLGQAEGLLRWGLGSGLDSVGVIFSADGTNNSNLKPEKFSLEHTEKIILGTTFRSEWREIFVLLKLIFLGHPVCISIIKHAVFSQFTGQLRIIVRRLHPYGCLSAIHLRICSVAKVWQYGREWWSY